MTKKDFDIRKHGLVPKHVKISDKEKKSVLQQYNISVFDLPLIRKDDSALSAIDAKAGDVIKVVRKSPTAGESIFYRCVVNV